MSVLETPVPLLQNLEEFTQLLDLYRATKPSRVLEVGTYHGGSLYHWLRNAQPETTVVSVDSYVTGIDNSHLYAEWTPEGVEVVVIRGQSQLPATITRVAKHAPFDWIYIDADHRLDAVQQDWNLYRELAAPGALVVFHDITPSTDPSIDVAPLWQQLQASHQTVEIKCEDGWGIGILTLS